MASLHNSTLKLSNINHWSHSPLSNSHVPKTIPWFTLSASYAILKHISHPHQPHWFNSFYPEHVAHSPKCSNQDPIEPIAHHPSISFLVSNFPFLFALLVSRSSVSLSLLFLSRSLNHLNTTQSALSIRLHSLHHLTLLFLTRSTDLNPYSSRISFAASPSPSILLHLQPNNHIQRILLGVLYIQTHPSFS